MNKEKIIKEIGKINKLIERHTKNAGDYQKEYIRYLIAKAERLEEYLEYSL